MPYYRENRIIIGIPNFAGSCSLLSHRYLHQYQPTRFIQRVLMFSSLSRRGPSRTIKETMKEIHVVTDIIKELLPHAAPQMRGDCSWFWVCSARTPRRHHARVSPPPLASQAAPRLNDKERLAFRVCSNDPVGSVAREVRRSPCAVLVGAAEFRKCSAFASHDLEGPIPVCVFQQK